LQDLRLFDICKIMLCKTSTLVVLLIGVCAVDGYRRKRQEVKKHEQGVDTEGVPYEVTNAIRQAKGLAKQALQEAEARENEMNARKATAEQTAAQKAKAESEANAAAKEAAARTKEASDQAKVKAAAAQAALESKGDWNDATNAHQQAQDNLEAATAAYNDMKEQVQAEIRRLNQELAQKEQEMLAAQGAEKQADQKASEGAIAYKAAQDHEDAQVKALTEALQTLKQANKVSSEKAASAKVAARESEAAQSALNDAVAAVAAAKAVVKEKRDIKSKLWDLYDRVEEFYDASSKLTRVMRRSDEECSDSPDQCLISDGPGGGRRELQVVLESYNSMVLAFDKIKQLYIDVYAEIAVAGIEIETNAMGQVHLSCDPYRELEEAGDAAAFNAKCGDGLWPALGLTKNRFF